MKKYWILSLLMPVLMLFSCTDDTSAYLPQEKEDVDVDQVTPENGDKEDGDEVLPEGELVIGLHEVKLDVKQPDGTVDERRFKYYLPITVDRTKPISLIFEFHGSWSYDAKADAPDPIGNISTAHTLIQHAIKENCVVCFPAGTPTLREGAEEGAVNWQDTERELPFVDAMVDYFKSRTPNIDENRIYSTGQSSGAIFSFALAFYRSEVFAAVTPRAGQMKISSAQELPSRAVPIRVFAGVDDKTVMHSAILINMEEWAERIGGYFPDNMVYTKDSFEIDNYKMVDTRIWEGANTDLQIFSLQDEGHGISIGYCMPYMWEFMNSHPKDATSAPLFVNAEVKEIQLLCGEKTSFRFSCTAGATVSVEDAPRGWKVELDGNELKIASPGDFFSNIQRNGEFYIAAEKDGKIVRAAVKYGLTAPKSYFEVGDIYFNADFEPVGVVCWVNEANIREAKIVELTGCGKYGTIQYCGKDGQNGLGLDFQTPDKMDGEGNTAAMVARNKTLPQPFTSYVAAFMWAHEYSYQGETGWYLPAVGEMEEMAKNLDKINAGLEAVGGVPFVPRWGSYMLYSSTTELKEGARTKTIYAYDFTHKYVKPMVSRSVGQEYFGYCTVRAIKKVTK